MDLKEKVERSKALYAQARSILENKDATAEDKAKVQGILAEAAALKADAVQMKNILTAAAELDGAIAVEAREIADKGLNAGSKAFTNWGEFLYCVALATKGTPDKRLVAFEDDEPKSAKTTMQEGVGQFGGFLVPTEQSTTMMSVVSENSLARAGGATVIPMRRRQIDMPILDQTGTTAGQPHWFGGMQFYWAEEGGLKTQSDPKFRQISLVAHKLIGYTRASDELLDDSAIGLDAFLGGPLGMAGGIGWMEDYAFLRGSGAGQPQGVLNAPATISIARTAVNPPVQYTDLVNMLENFLPTGTGAWYISQSLLSSLMVMQDPEGHYIWTPSARDGVPTALLGFPVHFTEKLPAAGSAGDILLADWRYYLIGDRQATTIESTKFDRWQYDETSWRAVHRVDGQPWLNTPLTLADGSSQVSPFVQLGAKTT